MNFKQLYSIFFSLVVVFGAQAQEELGTLPYRAEQYKANQVSKKQFGSRADGDSTIRYLFNTLELPVIDDFSKNHIKVFHKDFNHPSIFDSTSYKFVVDGVGVDSIEFKLDTVYDYRVDPVAGNLDSTVAKTMNIVFFDTAEVFFKVDSISVFPTSSFYVQNGITRIINHKPDSVLYNSSESNIYGRDDDFSLWIARGPYINTTMSKGQPTIGVLTFDGLDSTGLPYDNSSRLTYGISDFLISKPINLYDKEISVGNRQRYSLNDSIYFSFFYQAQGYGDLPEAEDSLVLDFYDVTTNRWNRVWGMGGDTTKPFERVSIHIKDTNYLQNGFRFRFKNYATQSGNFDHWHIDYIRLIEGGGVNDEIKDFAIVNPIRSLLKEYTAIPYEHYKTDPGKFMMDTVNLELRNLSFTSDILTSRYKVYKANDINYSFLSNQKVQSSVEERTTLPYEISQAPNNYQFPIYEEERQYFKVQFETFSSQDVYRSNDTLYHFQVFDRFYSYDDKSAEKTYFLNEIGTNIAMRFNAPVKDTLKSILINFVQTFEQTTAKHRVNIKVYNNLSSAPIYESGALEVQNKAPGDFMRHVLSEDIIVEGDFYIGWEQLSATKTYVGFDINYNNTGNTFISQIEGVWFNSQFEGTVMMRADFGDGSEKPLNKKKNAVELEPFNVFPNPSTGQFSLLGIGTDAKIELYNLQGRMVESWNIPQEIYYANHLENGIYILMSTNQNGETVSSKIIIAK